MRTLATALLALTMSACGNAPIDSAVTPIAAVTSAAKSDASASTSAPSPTTQASAPAPKSSAGEPPAAAESSASTPDAKPHAAPTVGAPSSLALCKGASKDPLAAICKLGGPAAGAKFECASPEPMTFCPKEDNWACTHSVFAKTPAPPVRYGARFEHSGPALKEGDVIDVKKMHRVGTVHLVGIDFDATSDEAETISNDASAKILGWGCVLDSAEKDKKVFDCGTWEVAVSYLDIVSQVEVTAAPKGKRSCY